MFSGIRTTLYKALHGEEPAGAQKLGDFTSTPRLIWIAGLALPIGYVSAYQALILLKLIGVFTNLFFFQRLSLQMTSRAANHLGGWEVVVPVVGALMVGFMARFGSER